MAIWLGTVLMVDWSAFGDLDVTKPGIVAGVAVGGAVADVGSFGADEPGGQPLTEDTVFYVASVAKQFTAACVGLAVLDGAMRADDRVRQWVPELPAGWDPVRIEHLIAHTAGLPDDHAIDVQGGFRVDSPFTTGDRLALIASYEPNHPPGQVHRYSNHGYVLLAVALERAVGSRLGEFAETHIFGPLSMSRTSFRDIAPSASVPGWVGGTQRIDVAFTCAGDGGLDTCISDLAKWDHWLPSSPLAPLMLTDRPTLADGRWAHDAWGISIRTHHGRRIESHGGSIDGYLATYVRFPELGCSFMALANSDQWGIAGFGARNAAFLSSLLVDDLDLSQPSWATTHGVPLP